MKITIILVLLLCSFSNIVIAQVNNLYKGELYPDTLFHNNDLVFKRDSSYYRFDYYMIHDYGNHDSDSVWAVIYNRDIDSTQISFLYLKKEFYDYQSKETVLESSLMWKMDLSSFNLLVDSLDQIMYDSTIYDNCQTLCNILLVSNTLDRLHIESIFNKKRESQRYIDFRKKVSNIISLIDKNSECRHPCTRIIDHITSCVNYYNDNYDLNLSKTQFLSILWNEEDARYKAINNGYCFSLKINRISKLNTIIDTVVGFYWLGDVIEITD